MGNGLKSCKQKHTLLNTPLLGTSLFLLLFTYSKSLNMWFKFKCVCVYIWKEEEEEVENLRIFSVKELKKATNEFKIERVVEGEDTYVQTFYKGCINETTSKLPVSVMEGLVYSQKSLEDWKISKVCPFFLHLVCFIYMLCYYLLWANKSMSCRKKLSR